MQGLHMRKRGDWWHYFRHRPRRYINIEPRPIITFALRTTNFTDAKLKAAQTTKELEQQWEEAMQRGVSLQNLSMGKQYKASVATNQAHGFQQVSAGAISDQDLLARLRFLVEGQYPTGEQKEVLGLIEKPNLSMMAAFERFCF